MKYFPEFYRILEQFREPRIETVDREFRAKKRSRELKLYQAVGEGLIRTDREATGTLYEENLNPQATRYTSLKNRLKVRMLNSLFHLNLKRAGFSDYAQAFYKCHRRMFMVKFLSGLGAELSAVRMAENTLELATKFEITDVALEMARILRQTSGNSGDESNFQKYDEILKLCQERYSEELLAYGYRDKIIMVLNRFFAGYDRYIQEFEGYIFQLTALLKESSSYNFQRTIHEVRTMAIFAAGRHKELIEAAQNGFAFIDSRPQLAQRERKAFFWYWQLRSFLSVQDYHNAEIAATECEALYNLGSNDWFAYAQMRFIWLMNTIRVSEANEIFSKAVENTRFVQQTEHSQQHWEVYQFFLRYAMRYQPGYDAKQHPITLDFKRLMQLSKARRDKAGMNMLIQIANALYLIETRKYDDMDNFMRSISEYRQHHPEARQGEQTRIFLQLLRLMVNNAYAYKYCEKAGRERFEWLKSQQFQLLDPEKEIIVLPYWWLWERLLDRMKESDANSSLRRTGSVFAR